MSMALQMMNLPDIDRVVPKGEEDEACFEEVRKVLEKHGKLERFGLCLLHNHFHIEEGEILSEACDIESRTLTIKPVQKLNVPECGSLETIWRLDTGSAQLCCHRHA
jgi:alpha-tubulin suppressor-like RCC1 family protein